MSAGASFHTGIAIGKFHGVMRPTTPERTAERVQPLVGDGRLVHLADRPPRLTRRVAEDRRCAQRFEPCLAQRLPHLRGHVLRDLLGARLDRRGRFREEGRALPGRQRGPRGERLARGLDRGTRVLGRRGRIDARHLRRPPWAPLLVRLSGRALAPFAADVVAGGRSGHRSRSWDGLLFDQLGGAHDGVDERADLGDVDLDEVTGQQREARRAGRDRFRSGARCRAERGCRSASHSTSSANDRRICAVNVSPSNTMRPHSSVTRSVRWIRVVVALGHVAPPVRSRRRRRRSSPAEGRAGSRLRCRATRRRSRS